MALTYADAATLANDTAWQNRVKACIGDVATSTIRALPQTTTNYVQLTNLSVRLLQHDSTLLEAVYWLVAANAPAGITALATPTSATYPDTGSGSLRVAVRQAMDSLVTI